VKTLQMCCYCDATIWKITNTDDCILEKLLFMYSNCAVFLHSSKGRNLLLSLKLTLKTSFKNSDLARFQGFYVHWESFHSITCQKILVTIWACQLQVAYSPVLWHWRCFVVSVQYIVAQYWHNFREFVHWNILHPNIR